MTDKKLQELMNATIRLKLKYQSKLELLEQEYERRFGYNPSEIDDDNFIDTFHYAQGSDMTVAKLIENAKMLIDRERERIDIKTHS